MTARVVHDTFTIERRYGCTPAAGLLGLRRSRAEAAVVRGIRATGRTPYWELDFRVGGGGSSGRAPGGSRHVCRGRFLDIVPDERIVFAYELLRDDRLIWSR